MKLCTYSRSEVYAAHILAECPLGLSAAEKKAGCPCHTRKFVNDLRVSACQYPETWRGERIKDEARLVASIRAKVQVEKAKAAKPAKAKRETQPKPEKVKPMEATQTKPPEADPKSHTLAVASMYGLSPSIYDRIANPTEFVLGFGKAMAASCMFGCKNDQQGMVLAMACLAERKSPVELARRYHIIGGNLSMKADAMLAEFRARGGEHKIIERSAERAEIELKTGSQKLKFSFTWEEAKGEDYVYCKDGKTLKDNWATPRRRMQMLWARLVSDSVRAMMPEVNAGQYTPEELGGVEQPEPAADDGVIDVPFAVEESKPQQQETKTPVATAEAPAAAVSSAAAAKTAAAPAAAPIASQATAQALADSQAGTPCTRDQLVEMKRIKDSLGDGLKEETWKAALKKVGGEAIEKANQLTSAGANRVIDWLLKQVAKGKPGSPLDQFANQLLNSGVGQ